MFNTLRSCGFRLKRETLWYVKYILCVCNVVYTVHQRDPTHATHLNNVDLTMSQRLQHWPNIKSALGRSVGFSGTMTHDYVMYEVMVECQTQYPTCSYNAALCESAACLIQHVYKYLNTIRCVWISSIKTHSSRCQNVVWCRIKWIVQLTCSLVVYSAHVFVKQHANIVITFFCILACAMHVICSYDNRAYSRNRVPT